MQNIQPSPTQSPQLTATPTIPLQEVSEIQEIATLSTDPIEQATQYTKQLINKLLMADSDSMAKAAQTDSRVRNEQPESCGGVARVGLLNDTLVDIDNDIDQVLKKLIGSEDMPQPVKDSYEQLSNKYKELNLDGKQKPDWDPHVVLTPEGQHRFDNNRRVFDFINDPGGKTGDGPQLLEKANDLLSKLSSPGNNINLMS